MTDPKPITVEEAREIRRAARTRDKAGLLAIQPGDHLALLDRLVATAQQAAQDQLCGSCPNGYGTTDSLCDYHRGWKDALDTTRELRERHEAEQRWVPVSENTVALAKFTAWVLEQAGEGCEVYGEDAQDYAVKLGLLTPTVMDAPCGEICPCAEVGEFPLKCNRFSDALQSALPPQPEV